MTDRYAVIGNPIEQSKSPLIHTAFAQVTGQDIDYTKVLSPLGAFAQTVDAFRAAGGRGMNVTAPFKLDARISSVVALIKRDVANNLSARYLAAQVDLSEPRLSQLFKDTLGVPIRRYRQWHRLFVTAVGVTQGLSLTTAALEAGFTDSAHFSRTFRSILGMPPSAMLNPRGRMRMFAG